MLKDRARIPVIRYRVACGRPVADGRNFPVQLDHFEVTETSQDKSGEFVLAKHVMDHLGERPMEVPFFVDSDDVEDFLVQRYECRVKIDGRTQVFCAGDGVKARRLLKAGLVEIDCKSKPKRDDGSGYAARTPVDLVAAVKKSDSWKEDFRCCYAQNDDQKLPRCFPTTEMVFRLAHAAGGGLARYRSHGHGTADRVASSLQDVKDLTGGALRGVPLKLVLTRKRMQRPGGKTATHSLVHVELAVSPEEALRVALSTLQDRHRLEAGMSEVRALLAAPKSDDEERAIDAEFATVPVVASVITERAEDEKPSGAALPFSEDDAAFTDDDGEEDL